MVMMEAPLELKGRLQGGLMQSLLRRFANEESYFNNISKQYVVMGIVCFLPH